jgi:3-oxoacyl-[acyl-carrier protein] reductase
VVLVTGAAGGLGGALAMEFDRQGWRVAAGYHRHTLPVAGPVWPVRLDVTNGAEVEAAVGAVLARWGRLDALVNNAGLVMDRPVWQLSEEDWDRVLAVNLRGAFLCARAVLRPMRDERAGQIVNIGSLVARQGARGQANYAAAKAGLLGLTTALAREYGPHNIRVNTVLPGVLHTPMTASLPAAARAAYRAANVLGRLNSVEEVARFVVFLAGTENISGQVFALDSRIGRWT